MLLATTENKIRIFIFFSKNFKSPSNYFQTYFLNYLFQLYCIKLTIKAKTGQVNLQRLKYDPCCDCRNKFIINFIVTRFKHMLHKTITVKVTQ